MEQSKIWPKLVNPLYDRVGFTTPYFRVVIIDTAFELIIDTVKHALHLIMESTCNELTCVSMHNGFEPNITWSNQVALLDTALVD